MEDIKYISQLKVNVSVYALRPGDKVTSMTLRGHEAFENPELPEEKATENGDFFESNDGELYEQSDDADEYDVIKSRGHLLAVKITPCEMPYVDKESGYVFSRHPYAQILKRFDERHGNFVRAMSDSNALENLLKDLHNKIQKMGNPGKDMCTPRHLTVEVDVEVIHTVGYLDDHFNLRYKESENSWL
jgi:hypothetical protein